MFSVPHGIAEPEERVASALRRCPVASLELTPTTEPDQSGPGATAPPANRTESTTRRAAVTLVEPDSEAGALVVVVDGFLDSTESPDPNGEQVARSGRSSLHVVDTVIGCAAADGVVRGAVMITGELTVPSVPLQRRLAVSLSRSQPDPSLLSVGSATTIAILRPSAVTLCESAGVTSVETEQLFLTPPDPFAELEGMWIAHLNDQRCPVVDRMAARIGSHRFRSRPVVTAIDRFGLTLAEIVEGGRRFELRLAFDDDCIDVTGLGRQIRLLMGCPRSARPLRSRNRGA